MKLSSCQETNTANILFKPIGTGFGDELLRLVIVGDQIDNITSSIVADSVEDKLLSIDKVHLCRPVVLILSPPPLYFIFENT